MNSVSCLPRCLLESDDESDSLHVFVKTLFQLGDAVPPLFSNDCIWVVALKHLPPQFVVLYFTTDPIALASVGRSASRLLLISDRAYLDVDLARDVLLTFLQSQAHIWVLSSGQS